MKKAVVLAVFLFLLLGSAVACQSRLEVSAGNAPSEEATGPAPSAEVETPPVPTRTATPDDLLLLWEGRPAGEGMAGKTCGRLEIRGRGEASFGPCDGSPTTTSFAAPYWEEMVARFAPFSMEDEKGQLRFEGQGAVGGPEWQRALVNWARLTYGELASGRACASCRTILTWSLDLSVEAPQSCAMLWVTDFGYAYRGTVPCEGGQTQVTAEGWLQTEEWAQLETWLRSRAPLTLGDRGASSLLGRGTERMNETEQAALGAWAEGVAARLQPSSLEDEAPGSLALCPAVPRPALALFMPGEGYLITDPLSGTTCKTTLDGDVPGLFQAVGDALYYPVLQDEQFVVKRLTQYGVASLLSFTAVDRDDALLYHSFVVSPDGSHIAWSATSAGPEFKSSPTSNLWLAGMDGRNIVSPLPPLQPVGPDVQPRALVPVRFSEDNSTLFYTLQLLDSGGIWSAYTGRYGNLYALRLNTDADPTLIYDCADEEVRLCIGDFVEVQGQVQALAYVENKSIVVVDGTGAVLNKIDPEADYVGYPTFGPQGDLIFYSAEGADAITPDEGTLYRVNSPLTEATTYEVLARGAELFLPRGWLDAGDVVVTYVSGADRWGTAIVALDGSVQVLQAEPNDGFVTVIPAPGPPPGRS